MASSLAACLFLLAILITLNNSSPSVSLDSPSLMAQASILVTLKQTLCSSAPFLNTWNLSDYHKLCYWEGVGCDEANRMIISLDVSNTNISGPLPPELTRLVHLQYLNISNNQFNGSLSSYNFSSFATLEVLDAYNNNFFAHLPLGVANLTALLHLDFGGNYFSGSIPPIYGQLEGMSYLSLAGNDLSGYIPREIGNLKSLKRLYLGYYNLFSGGIPPEIGKLSNLVHLDLSSCGLEGTVPPELGNLKKLDTLFLQTNQLTGTIPPELGNLSSLRALDLSNNALTGGIPDSFSQLRELYLLYLFLNRFHMEIPRFIAELPKLELLKLWQNNFTGTIPQGLGKSGTLRELDLSTNKLTGEVPPSLCHGRKLEILILLNNFLFGPLPDDLGQCITLSRVRMGQNYLSGPVPKGFFYLPNLLLVELQNNYLTGWIMDVRRGDNSTAPSKLGQLNLSNNRMFGLLPSSIGNFSALQILLLNANQFTGEIPTQIGQLKNVIKIDLSRNNFSGGVPQELSSCSLLSFLDLSQNQLAGAVPPQISQIHNLNYLNLSWNKLSQNIPKEIGGMKSLTSVDFSHNDFSGRIPETGQFAFFNMSSFLANPELCGSVLNPCNYFSTSSSQSHQHNGIKVNLSGKFKLLFALGLLVCSLVFAATVIIKSRRTITKNSGSWKLTAFQKLNFSSQDIIECLKETNIIGRGGAGVVYRGTVPNGDRVAVKRLLGIGREGSSRDNGFNAEIQTLGKIRHRNIVRLLAFCSNKETNVLVYEYMPNGSLGELLHGKRGGYLTWEVRLKVGIEAARGLCYLHHDCCPPILHRDVKSNNILLNGDFEAHVADFGLAKFLRDTGMSECMSAIAGSYGYIAPEYAYTLKVDEKSDVYSFGVVLLELITGRKPIDDFGEDGLDIVQWAKMNTNWNKEGVVKILDNRLDDVPLEEAMQVFFVGMLCVQEQSVERPTMREVLQMLCQAKHE